MKLLSLRVQCPDCGATHVRPEYVDPADPPETLEKTCIAPHPERGADFEGCGETHDLDVVAMEDAR